MCFTDTCSRPVSREVKVTRGSKGYGFAMRGVRGKLVREEPNKNGREGGSAWLQMDQP